MSCSNCFNGCTEIVSDRCVQYTGIDIPVLGIKTGDSLSYVEQALIEFLTSTLDGTGIHPVIDPQIICDLVKNNLPTCGDLNLNDFLTALIKSACQLQTQVTALSLTVSNINNQLSLLEGPYNVGCLTGVDSASGTHAILQAVITRLCQFIVDVETNYVQLADLDALIQAYLDSQNPPASYYTKMVPYVAVEYYGSLTGFDITGAGTGVWEKVYLCNGNNGTPDKRGRVPVGAIVGMGGGTLDPEVAPGGFNPNYALGTKAGTNSVGLTVANLPSHTHTATISPNPHSHTASYNLGLTFAGGGVSTAVQSLAVGPGVLTTSTVDLSVTNANTGSDTAHQNNQPAIACYYIMYIP